VANQTYGKCVWCTLERKYNIELNDHYCKNRLDKLR